MPSTNNSNNSQALAWVGVDWGTSSLRLWGLDQQDQILWQVATDQGMDSLKQPDDFAQVLLAHLQPYLSSADPLPVICCGMVGARQGWLDAGYYTVPWPAQAAKQSVTRLQRVPDVDPRMTVYIAAGLSQKQPTDVMRGEETQVLGLMQTLNQSAGLVCLPGTHSKWVSYEDARVVSFSTYMTGELYALLSKQSILRHSVQGHQAHNFGFPSSDELIPAPHKYIFLVAVETVLMEPDKAVRQLFAIRARDMLDRTEPLSSALYLSGLLIGQELAATQHLWDHQSVDIIGASALSRLYQLALQTQGSTCTLHSATDMTLAGLKQYYQQLDKQ